MNNVPSIAPVGAVGAASGNAASTMEALKTLVQQAMETKAQTEARALKGDQEAIRQLAVEAAREAEMAPPQNTENELNIKA
jgi:hypothetical protein